ncbi:MAG: polysulfide reductase NrfD [Chthonomonas sp.]|nr:polysulfide reductase NrfD [Chthonomonas sp.]
MAAVEKEPINEPLITGEHTYADFDEQIGRLVLHQSAHGRPWQAMLAIGILGAHLLLLAIGVLLWQGIGVWGNNQPVAWGFDIINFVWWIGIGHAGTLISAVLLLVRQQWRNSINRFAEAMTIFAVMCAGLYPLLHTGRPWVAYWLFPYPNVLAMWPNFRSPLVWDVFAVSTYATISILFWFFGLIPDFATLRDKATTPLVKKIYGLLAMGWRGSAQHWSRYESAYLILAGLSTPLVLSVHSIVSLDFAVSIVPGWNVTLFPPYFVAGAVFAGFAMVLTFAIPLRKIYKLDHLITDLHLDWMAKIMLTTGLIVFYGYLMEVYYSFLGNEYEMFMTSNRFSGPYATLFWLLWFFNGLLPLILFIPKNRRNTKILLLVSTGVSIGMWLERFVIIPMSLHRDYLPSSWQMYYPTVWDIMMFAGTIFFFITLMFLFVRFLPFINIFEVKDLKYRMEKQRDGGGH